MGFLAMAPTFLGRSAGFNIYKGPHVGDEDCCYAIAGGRLFLTDFYEVPDDGELTWWSRCAHEDNPNGWKEIYVWLELEKGGLP